MKDFLPRTTLDSVSNSDTAHKVTVQSAPFHQPLTAAAKAYRNCADSSD